MNVIRCMWIFKQKLKSDGSLEWYKARLVGDGRSQQIGVDCSETFSPVVKPATIRTVLSLALSYNWDITQLDVKNAFLHGHLYKTVFMNQPPGFRDKNFPDHVCRLKKSLYDFKQASRAWYQRFTDYVTHLGFRPSSSDHSLFIYRHGIHTAYILLYVDDIIMVTSSPKLKHHFMSHLSSEFVMKDLGPLSYFLGIAVTRTKDGLFLSQSRYAQDILHRAKMNDCNPVQTPVDTFGKLSAESGDLLDDPTFYRSLDGALQYLTLTRPDISYAVQQVCMYMHAPRTHHFLALKRILRYVKGTIDLGILMQPFRHFTLVAYTDADWAGCPDTRRSTSSYCVFLGDNLLSWSSKRQTVMSRSSAEAEYRGIANVVSEICWLRKPSLGTGASATSHISGQLLSLEDLNLNNNQLTGNIPMSVGQLSKLKSLDLSYNSLAGVLSETHFTKLKNLIHLDLSLNSLAFNFSSQWIPPFQLNFFFASSCSIGPHFPNWLQTTTNLQRLDLSNSSIRDTIPEWFENILYNILYLDLSNNHIKGKLPQFHFASSNEIGNRILKMNSNKFEGSLASFPYTVQILDLSDNLLSGHFPQTDGTMNLSLEVVNLSNNHFTGIFPIHLCKLASILVLDLSNNKFSGRLPGCLGNLISLQVLLDLSNNNISGYIPSSLGSLTDLSSLHLRNNRLEGNLPLSLQNLTNLVTLDIGNNFLEGTIPFWIGENLSSLRILDLRSNKFIGKIPLQRCQLNALQHLNLAKNNITGRIPHCFVNLSGMITNQVNFSYYAYYYEENIFAYMKGIELVYTSTIKFLISLDLSSNKINGEIPDVLMNLVGLKSLNLSRNQLIGHIPMMIGNLSQMESLDFSMNMLSGRIPQSLTSLNYLSSLNLSFNNFSGAIPTGNQLQTLVDPSIYVGNNKLCGPPASRSCKGNNSPHNRVGEGEDEVLWFYSGMGSGFVAGFTGLVCSLYFIRACRLSYFKILGNVYSWLDGLLLLNLAWLRRKFF
ncbi:receptor-like protein EIX2 [Bidens hawaiensis]|uniref:receptor-like protein EIX2 n=1 Tax=Bidens hawaiensis TaxID=980011 RepID=UPI00404A29C3